ncbi:hypothetical protein JZO70_13610 [Enterococcus sp. 669A]|uniref:DUF1653 domain-containing protein n=1 Tax=Candidatus Enterococcus moelleringii TaxID=2815325 RepID=A0ABS3LC45_9ENTE|nr:hypothetical protein [Enterococcus sp. 669A]MBO1307208.1 hypothetical protein [Enterococcus sp. 669A]
MQALFTIKRSGAARVGEVFKYDGKLFVITHMVKILACDREGHLQLEVVAQQYGLPAEYDDVGRFYQYEKRYLEGKDRRGKTYDEAGQAYPISKEKCGFVSQILFVKPEQEELTVHYSLQRFVPWSEEEMKRAVKKERLATFKVIDGQG